MPTFHSNGIDYAHSEAVVLSDENTQPEFRAIMVQGTAGNVKMTFHDGSVDTWYCNKGQQYPCRPKIIWDNGTTATTISGLR